MSFYMKFLCGNIIKVEPKGDIALSLDFLVGKIC